MATPWIKRIAQLSKAKSVQSSIVTRNFSTSRLFFKKRDDDDIYENIKPPPPPDEWTNFKQNAAYDLKRTFIPHYPRAIPFSLQCDVLVLGGGVIGSSVAYFIKRNMPVEGLKVTVVEKDPTYQKSSTVLSMGGIRTQFSLRENIEMSLYGTEFLRTSQKSLAVEDSPGPDVHFNPQGYLFLASQAGAQQLKENHDLQTYLGCKVELLSPTKLKERFPWVNTNDVELASLGIQNEGWFDPWSLLYAFKRKNVCRQVEYAHAEVVGFEFNSARRTNPGLSDDEFVCNKCVVKTPTGEVYTIKFSSCVIAAGADSGRIAKMARIGRGEKLLSVPLPVEPRKRYVYCFQTPESPSVPGINCPLVIDHTGAYFRREGLANTYVCGQSPPLDEEPTPENLEVDYDFFENTVWPNIANRCPGFETLKVKSSWAGYYDYNYFDQNAIVGTHPYLWNFYLACGFSGHGIQQAPAIGRAIAELILEGHYRTIDLSRLGFSRLVVKKKVLEKNIV